MSHIVCIVEGDGEVKAVPLLLRRIAEARGVFDLNVSPPIRVHRHRFLQREEEFHRHVRLAAAKAGDGMVLVLLDADDDCPAELAAAIETRAREVAGPVRLAVVLANREYEAWFLAGVASLAGKRGLPETLQTPVAAEAIRNAKGWLGERMASRGYHPVSDQPALSAMLDIDLACAHSRSFRKFVKECERALAE